MQVTAKSKYIRVSPYKLRPIIDVIRGSRLDKAVAWLNTQALRKVNPVIKTVLSAYSNSKNTQQTVPPMNEFIIKEIRVDGGPIIKYYKPGSMGRAMVQRKRLSHLQVILQMEEKIKKEK